MQNKNTLALFTTAALLAGASQASADVTIIVEDFDGPGTASLTDKAGWSGSGNVKQDGDHTSNYIGAIYDLGSPLASGAIYTLTLTIDQGTNSNTNEDAFVGFSIDDTLSGRYPSSGNGFALGWDTNGNWRVWDETVQDNGHQANGNGFIGNTGKIVFDTTNAAQYTVAFFDGGDNQLGTTYSFGTGGNALSATPAVDNIYVGAERANSHHTGPFFDFDQVKLTTNVPEPGSLALLGLGGLLIARRRRG